MDDKLAIKVNISDRVYPLKINRDEEENIRKAAKLINDKITQYKQVFRDKDAYDILAMATLHLGIQVQSMDSSDSFKLLSSEIRQINSDLDDYIKNKR
jgi:cell division protein ZapA